MIDLSLNEAESLAAKAARGAGFSWGLADEIARAARGMAAQGEWWGEALLALARAAGSFEPPDRERMARWRRREPDAAGVRPLCPVRTAALLLDSGVEIDAGPLRLANVGLPVWLGAMLTLAGMCVAGADDPLAARGDATIRRGAGAALRDGARRAAIAPQTLAALNAYAARVYVPDSERSRTLGAGGGRVDED